MYQQTVKPLTYTGKAQDFPIWSTRFMTMMQTKGLYNSLLGTEEPLDSPAPLDNRASNDEKKNHKALKDAYEKEVSDIKEKRNNVLCHLALTLDARTLILMRHDCMGDDGIGDGAKAWIILRERFQCVETPTVVTFGCAACSATARGFWETGQHPLQRTGVGDKAERSRGSSLRDPLQRLGTEWSAFEAWKFCYKGKLQPGNELHRFEEKAAALPWEHITETLETKRFSGFGSGAWLQEGAQERKLFCVWDPWTLCQGLQEEGYSTMQALVRRATSIVHSGDLEMEANKSQGQWLQHWLHQPRNNGQLLPSGRQQACE